MPSPTTASPSGWVGSIGMCSLMTCGRTFEPTMRCQMRIISSPCGLTSGVSRHAITMPPSRKAVGQIGWESASRPSAASPGRRDSTVHPDTGGRRLAVRDQEQHAPSRDRQPQRHGAAEDAAVQVRPHDVQRDEPREPPRGAPAAFVVDRCTSSSTPERDGEHVRADEVVERADEEAPADDERRKDRPHPALHAPPEDEREQRGHAGGESEEHGVEPAGTVGQGHQHLRTPLLGHPLVVREGVAERIGLRHAAIEDDLADLDVPEGTGVVEAPFAKREQEQSPRR